MRPPSTPNGSTIATPPPRACPTANRTSQRSHRARATAIPISPASGIPKPRRLNRREKYFKDGINGLGEDDADIPFLNLLEEYKATEVDMTPAAAAVRRARADVVGGATTCQPWGMPMVDTLPSPYRIVQTPGVTYVLYEENMSHREIFTDGRKHTPDPQPTWLGYSVGRWEGDTLVVDTVGLNDRAPLDAIGHPHSEALKITERFHRPDFGHIELQIAFDDPDLLHEAVQRQASAIFAAGYGPH